jgi:DNA-binding Xre family transcriptional regulator
MLSYNFDQIFNTRGIDKPFMYLKKAGFSNDFASNIRHNRIKRLGLEQMEKLCIALHCTPNDLFDWKPDTNTIVGQDHALHTIRKPKQGPDLNLTLKTAPLSELYRINELIEDKLEEE